MAIVDRSNAALQSPRREHDRCGCTLRPRGHAARRRDASFSCAPSSGHAARMRVISILPRKSNDWMAAARTRRGTFRGGDDG